MLEEGALANCLGGVKDGQTCELPWWSEGWADLRAALMTTGSGSEGKVGAKNISWYVLIACL